MRKFIKYLIRLILGILIPIILYLIVGIILSVLSTNPDKIECEEKSEIYVVSNGIHLDIIIPIKLMKYELVKELDIPNQANYVSFGWGDRGFYLETPTWNQLKFSVATRAIFLKSESAMHVDYYYNKSKSWSEIKICEEQYEELIEFVMNSFKRNDNKQIIPIDEPGYFETDKFYEANGSYSFMKTCNNWVNNGFKRSNIKTSIWSPFDYGVLYHIKRESSSK